MIPNRSRQNWLLTAAVTAGLAGLVLPGGCSKSAESKGNAQAQAAGAAEPGAAAGEDMAPTPVAPDTAADTGEGGASAAKGASQAPGERDPAARPAAGATAQNGSTGAETDFYTVAITYPASVEAGGSGVATIVITPKTGWKMNHEFPTKITVAAPTGVTVTKPEQKKDDAVRFADKGAAFEVPFTASAAGDKAFQAKLKFAVCTEATCDPKKEELAWVVAVK